MSVKAPSKTSKTVEIEDEEEEESNGGHTNDDGEECDKDGIDDDEEEYDGDENDGSEDMISQVSWDLSACPSADFRSLIAETGSKVLFLDGHENPKRSMRRRGQPARVIMAEKFLQKESKLLAFLLSEHHDGGFQDPKNEIVYDPAISTLEKPMAHGKIIYIHDLRLSGFLDVFIPDEAGLRQKDFGNRVFWDTFSDFVAWVGSGDKKGRGRKFAG